MKMYSYDGIFLTPSVKKMDHEKVLRARSAENALFIELHIFSVLCQWAGFTSQPQYQVRFRNPLNGCRLIKLDLYSSQDQRFELVNYPLISSHWSLEHLMHKSMFCFSPIHKMHHNQ